MPRKTKKKEPATPRPVRLTHLERAFVNEYFMTNFNGIQAAKRAGYSGDYNTLAQTAHQNLKKPKIRDEIEKRMEAHAMKANEVIARLAAQARGDIADVSDDDGVPGVKTAIENGTSHLIKKHVRKDTPYGEHVTVELHDPQTALSILLKHLTLESGKATERIEVNDNLTDAERADRIAALLARAKKRVGDDDT